MSEDRGHSFRQRRQLSVSCALLLTIFICQTAIAQNDRSSTDRARVLGILQHTQLHLDINNAPAHEVFTALQCAINVPIDVHYRNDDSDDGIHRDQTINLMINNVSARFAIELIIEQCAIVEPCTWQESNGRIEVGTKQQLSRPSANRVKLYPLRDLLLEPPDFGGSWGGDKRDFDNHDYNPAALTRYKDALHERKTPEELLKELIRGIIELVEPGNWDYGQYDHEHQATWRRKLLNLPPLAPSWGGKRSKVARLRITNNHLIIHAPNFMQRQIEREQHIIKPAAISDEARQQRSTAASTHDNIRITLLPLRRDRVDVTEEAEQLRARTFQQLSQTFITLDVHNHPVRDVIDRLHNTTGLPLIMRFQESPVASGIDPEQKVTLQITNEPAIDVLENVLEQCSAFRGECTWQIRGGFIELGTKARLSAPAARALRTYYIRDMMLQIPGDPMNDHIEEAQALDIVEEVVERTDPDAWDWGQVDYEQPLEPPINRRIEEEPDIKVDPRELIRKNVYIPPRKPAIIRYWRDVVIVNAPDYLHRQVKRYPKPHEVK